MGNAMRRRRLDQLLVLLAVAAVTGCVPATGTVVPRVSGRVVDLTGKPVAGATVSIEMLEMGEAPRKVRTGRHGRFRRAEEKRWFLGVFLPVHAMGPELTATAWHQGMRSDPQRFGGGLLLQQFLGLGNPSKSYELGDLMLSEGPSDRLTPHDPTMQQTGRRVRRRRKMNGRGGHRGR